MTSDSHQDPLLRAFDRLVRKAPAATLAVSPNHRVTVAEVDALARAAGGVLAAGTGAPGTAVGLQAANGPGFLAGLLALLRAGHPAVLFDRRTPELERRRIAGQVGAGAVLVCDDGWAAGAGAFRLEAIRVGTGAAPDGSIPRLPEATAVVKLTSGSSGAARGIAVTSEALLADDLALTASMGIGVEDRLLATIPFSHSYGLSSLVVPALVRGNPLVLPASRGPFGPVAAAADAGATVFPTVPAYLDALNRLNAPPPLPPSLRLVMTAGAPLPAETSARFRQVYGRTVHVFYGASESGGICYDREGGAAERGTVGTPVEGVTVNLASVESSATAGDAAEPAGPDGGRVVVRGPALALGYLPSPDPRLDGGRYVTDDLACWRGGELALVGRLNDLINVKGKKVDPREVERVLTALGPVEEALVMPAPAPGDGNWDGPDDGNGVGPRQGVRVRAVVACPAGSLSAEDVVTWCRRHLADHKVPRSVVLVEALPRNERGKVDRDALRRLGAEPVAEPDQS